MNALDLARIATRGQRAADLLDRYGLAAIRNAKNATAPTMRAVSYDGERSNRPDDYGVDRPNDPTGDAVANNLAGPMLAQRVAAAIAAFEQAAGVLTDLILTTVNVDDEDAGLVQPERTDDPGDGWCRSCYRDNGHLTPQATHADGRTMYRGTCKWCRLFADTYRQPAPLSILKLRHQGARLSPQIVERALARERRTR